jgi:hypothetical protein
MRSEIHGLAGVLEGDGLSLAQGGGETARATFEEKLNGFFDGVTRKLDFGRESVLGFLGTMGLYFPMLNITNVLSQILIGKLFQIIGGISGGVTQILIGQGKTGWMVGAMEKLALARKKLYTLEMLGDTGEDYARSLAVAQARVRQMEVALRTGVMPVPATRADLLWQADLAQVAKGAITEAEISAMGPHVSGTTMWGIGAGWGAVGMEARIASELEARVAPDIPGIVEDVLADHMEGLGEGMDLQVEADRLFEEHRGEMEKRLQDALMAAGEQLETLEAEVPITEEEQTANDEAIWQNRLNGAWLALGQATDLAVALQLREQLAMVCAEASTPDQQAYAQGLMALADEQVEILHQLLLEMYGASGSPDYTAGDWASQLKEATK